MLESFADIIGIFGVVLIILAYFLLQLGKIKANSAPYLISNFIGSLLLLYSLYYNWNWPSVIIEILWLLISAFGISKHLLLKNKL